MAPSETQGGRRTCGEERSVRTISSSGMTCAGLKKCAPTRRERSRIFSEMRSRLIVLVFVASTAPALHTRSSSAKMSCFSSSFSIAASMTMSAAAKPSYVSAPVTRPSAASRAAAVIARFFKRDARFAATRPSPASRNFWLISLRMTEWPARVRAVAMPEPMRPPPRTAMTLSDRGCSPVSVTPFTCRRHLSHVRRGPGIWGIPDRGVCACAGRVTLVAALCALGRAARH